MLPAVEVRLIFSGDLRYRAVKLHSSPSKGNFDERCSLTIDVQSPRGLQYGLDVQLHTLEVSSKTENAKIIPKTFLLVSWLTSPSHRNQWAYNCNPYRRFGLP